MCFSHLSESNLLLSVTDGLTDKIMYEIAIKWSVKTLPVKSADYHRWKAEKLIFFKGIFS